MSHLADRLHLKHLRLIAAVARHGQLSLAAHALCLTQPAASRALTDIEALIGAPLFDRHPKGMTPTALGEGLARRARSILDDLSDAVEEVEQLRHGRGGVVRIGAVTGAAVGTVVPAIRRLKALAPQVELHVEVAISDDLIADLTALRFDMVLARLPATARPGDFDLLRGQGEQVRIVAHAANPLAGATTLAALSDAHWVMQGPGSPIRRAVEQGFAAQNARPPGNVTNTASLLMALALLRSPDPAGPQTVTPDTITPDTVTPVSAEVAGLLTGMHGDLVILPLAQVISVAPYALITLHGRRLTPAAARCHALLAEALQG